MKHTLIIFALLTATIQTFAQSPRIKLNQITKDSLSGSVLISSPTDSGMVYSRDLFISYGADTVLILGGDTLAATSSIISSVLSDGVTIVGDGTTGSELTVDTATVIATKQDLDLYYLDSNPDGYTSNTGTVTSVGGTGTVNGISLSGTVTSSGNLTLGGTLSGVDLTSQVTGTLPVANGGTGSSSQNFVDLSTTQTVEGVKSFIDNTVFNSNSIDSGFIAIYGNNSFINIGADKGTGATLKYAANGNLEITPRSPFNTVISSGNFGLRTDSPDVLLDVSSGLANGSIKLGADASAFTRTDNTDKFARIVSPHYDIDTDNVAMLLNHNGSNFNNLNFGGGASNLNTATDIYFYTAANNTTVTGTARMQIKSDGEVWIGYTTDQGNYKLQVQDSVYVGGNVSANAYTTRSDIRLKQNITEYDNGLNDVMSLYPVYFYQREFPAKQRLGFIAQDVREIIPQAITDNEQDDYLGIEYSAFSAVLVKAIQEQQSIIETQATEIETLKSQIQLILSEIEQLKNN